MKASIIGTGFGERVAAEIYRKTGIEVVEIASPRHPEAVKRACAAPVDFVSIHSPPFMHKEHVFLALEHGRNIVCDKPFGKSADEARAMLEAAEAAGVIHLLNFEFRQEAQRKQAKALIEEGAIGKVEHVHWTGLVSGTRYPVRPYGWLWNRELGGGWIGAFGSHAIDAMRWLVGEIDTASGICRTDVKVRPDREGIERVCTAEDGFTACFTFENGATAVLDTSYATAVTSMPEIQILGSEGALILTGSNKLELKRADKADQQFDYPVWKGDQHEPAFSAWSHLIQQAIRDKRQIEPSFRDGLACAEVMDKLRDNAIWLTPEAEKVAAE
jgi:predicted dehydrogenase